MVRALVKMIIALLFLTGSLRMVNGWDSVGITTLYFSLFLTLSTILLFKKVELKYNQVTFVLMYLFLLFSILSALVNQDVKVCVRAAMFFVMFLSVNVVIPSYLTVDSERAIVKVIVVTHIPLLFIPIILNRGIDSVPYYGIFDNTNSLGGVAVTVLAVFLALFFKDIEDIIFYRKNRAKKFVFLNILLIFCLILIITYTSSRTSFIAILTILLSGLSLNIINAIKYRKLGSFSARFIVFLPILVLLYFILDLFSPLKQSVHANIFSKFERKSSDLLDGRGEIWKDIIDRSGFFGGGSDIFNGHVAIGSHNTFVTVVGMFGWIPLILMILFFILAFYYSINHFLTSTSKYKYLPSVMLITFLTLSMAEDMFYKLSFIATLALLGTSMNKKKIVIK